MLTYNKNNNYKYSVKENNIISQYSSLKPLTSNNNNNNKKILSPNIKYTLTFNNKQFLKALGYQLNKPNKQK